MTQADAQDYLGRMRRAFEELTDACERDCCGPVTEEGDNPCTDDEAIGAGWHGDTALTFGMIRRARAVLREGEGA